MKKLGFVTPWYGKNIPGGAEMELRGLVTHLHQAGVELEVLATCVERFASDWNRNFYREGLELVDEIPVRRFRVRRRDTVSFDLVNAKLMQKQPITKDEEEIYMREMVNSPALYEYIKDHRDEYGLFVFIPYMFGTTYYGILQCPEQAVLIPCFHNEAYIYLDIYKNAFEQMAGAVYLAQPECDLANQVFDLSSVEQAILGAGVDTDLTFDAARFRAKYQIDDPYLLYAGRKDVGKNIYTLIRYFCEFKRRHEGDPLKLVLIGGGDVEIPSEYREEILDLGFVDIQDKYDAYAGALTLCQPSLNESFSLVVMESWLCGRPVLVHGKCNVTKHFASEANAGLYFENYFEFEGCVEYFQNNAGIADAMGAQGRAFVLKNFSWETIVKKYTEFFEKVCDR